MLSVFAHLLGVTLLAALLSSLYWETDETAELPPALVVIVLPDEEPPPTIIELRFDPLTAPNGTPLEVAALDTPAMSPNTPQVKAPLAGSASLTALPKISASGLAESPQILLTPHNGVVGGGMEGRKSDAKARLVAERGGTPASEEAVFRGLNWLKNHQHPDGGWRFDLRSGPCRDQCRNSGSHDSTTAATGLALLAFLGAGQSHREGDFQTEVQRGLDYLLSRATPATSGLNSRGFDLMEGTMYGQGIATLALCEALALTGDETLREPAQQAVEFISLAQHPRGGWRYFPGQAGDITVFGWQWLALKSSQASGLAVPWPVWNRADYFLTSLEAEGGAAFGYQPPEPQATPTATAIGLLCRMYGGWRRNDPRLVRGVASIVVRGPSRDSVYYNYYATQVVSHFDGPEWPAWNEKLREQLIAAQQRSGHEEGSWRFPDSHTAPGGASATRRWRSSF